MDISLVTCIEFYRENSHRRFSFLAFVVLSLLIGGRLRAASSHY